MTARRPTALDLEPLPESVARARIFVRRCLQRTGATDDDIDTAVLLTSELVTNAVVHAATTIRLRVLLDRAEAMIDVEDASRRQLAFGESSPDALGGRGLELVARLALRHGSYAIPDDGKHVWFTVASA